MNGKRNTKWGGYPQDKTGVERGRSRKGTSSRQESTKKSYSWLNEVYVEFSWMVMTAQCVVKYVDKFATNLEKAFSIWLAKSPPISLNGARGEFSSGVLLLAWLQFLCHHFRLYGVTDWGRAAHKPSCEAGWELCFWSHSCEYCRSSCTVAVLLCGHAAVWLLGYVPVLLAGWLCACLAVWLCGAEWPFGSMAVWLCGYVAMCPCGCVAVWMCDCVAVRLCGCVAVWL